MTDYSTLTKLRTRPQKNDYYLDELDGSVRQDFSSKKYYKPKRFIVIDKEGEFSGDYNNIKAKLKLKEEELPLINKKYYRKEFINDNWDIISNSWASLCNEDTEEELEYLMELEEYIAEDDWDLFELEDFSASRSFSINGHYFSFPDIRSFKGYENAFTYKKVPALVFEVEFVSNIPSRYFYNFKHEIKEDVSYLSLMFNFNNLDDHLDKEMPYFDIHIEEIEKYRKEYITEKNENDTYCLFAFG